MLHRGRRFFGTPFISAGTLAWGAFEKKNGAADF
jgi:hypothetical protein